jgi:hypothetical protein
VFFAKRILPKNYRDDPFADPPPITENDINDGMFSLLNRGIIPRDVDLTPAFERGAKPFKHYQKTIKEKPAEKPPQWRHKVDTMYKTRGLAMSQSNPKDLRLNQGEHRDGTFLTSMVVDSAEVGRTVGTADESARKRRKRERREPVS